MASTPITYLNMDDPTGSIPDQSGVTGPPATIPASGPDASSLPIFQQGFLDAGNLLNQSQLQNLNSFWTKLQTFVSDNPGLVMIGAIFLFVMAANNKDGGGRR